VDLKKPQERNKEIMPYKNILLIDDDIDDADFFREAVVLLQKESSFRYETDPVKAFEELKISTKLPDLLFLDINMPRLNGLELLLKIRDTKQLQHMEIILISSPTEAVIRDLASTYEIERYMCKPNTFNELVSQLQEIL